MVDEAAPVRKPPVFAVYVLVSPGVEDVVSCGGNPTALAPPPPIAGRRVAFVLWLVATLEVIVANDLPLVVP
eukprot:CAMPEP_0118968072 /NCGR_PEP_ID=MMETSP1173-20130426/5365_1 /TAXON_ID=1034831 /ORGANISM="Rhizochromulina marina cf, Strain CCMP1243" /LENGTH=71 /DNA_ID=CAMNT_0006917129 /DNA_START=65 /DNA_END=277 /DNA_ORIENTATION=-